MLRFESDTFQDDVFVSLHSLSHDTWDDICARNPTLVTAALSFGRGQGTDKPVTGRFQCDVFQSTTCLLTRQGLELCFPCHGQTHHTPIWRNAIYWQVLEIASFVPGSHSIGPGKHVERPLVYWLPPTHKTFAVKTNLWCSLMAAFTGKLLIWDSYLLEATASYQATIR